MGRSGFGKVWDVDIVLVVGQELFILLKYAEEGVLPLLAIFRHAIAAIKGFIHAFEQGPAVAVLLVKGPNADQGIDHPFIYHTAGNTFAEIK